MRRRRHISPVRAAVAVALLAVMVATFDAAPSVALMLAPAFLLLAVLTFGYFPGEDLLDRLRAARWADRVPRRPFDARRPSLSSFVRRVGHTVAFALAVRPPPARPAAIS